MAVLVGRQVIKAGEGRETARRLGRKQLEKPPARTGGFFESVRTPAYGSFRLVRNVRLSIKYFGNLPWESFEGLNKSSPQNKIKISKKRWPERRRSWIFDGKTGQLYWSLNRKWPFTVFFKGEMSWKFCQQDLARAWSLLSLLWPKKKYPHRKPVWSQFPL